MQLRGNYIFVKPGEKAFLAASNFVNYIELGRPDSRGFYLLAEVEGGEFVVSARLFDEHGTKVAEIRRNNVIEGAAKLSFFPQGGYQVTDSQGRLLLRLALSGEPNETCVLQGKFYDETGELVAEGDEQDLRIYRAPAVLGKSGAARGIVIEAPVTIP